MAEPIRSFVVEGEKVSLPASEGDRFIAKYPNAKEFIGFKVGDETVGVPKGEADMFQMKYKDATALPEYNFSASSIPESPTTPAPEVSVNPQSQEAWNPNPEISETTKEGDGFWSKAGNAALGTLSGIVGQGVMKLPKMIEDLSQLPTKLMLNHYIQKEGEAKGMDQESLDQIKRHAEEISLTSSGVAAKDLAESEPAKWFTENAKRLESKSQVSDKSIIDLAKSGQYKTAIEKVGVEIARSLPYTLTALGGGTPGLVAMGLTTASKEYDDIKESDAPQAAKLTDAIVNGTAEALGEYVGTQQIGKVLAASFKSLGARQASANIKNALESYMSQVLKKYGLLAIPTAEGVSEWATTIAQNASAKYTGVDPNRSLMDGTGDSFIVGFAQGGAMHAGGTVLSKGYNKLAGDRPQIAQVEPSQEPESPSINIGTATKPDMAGVITNDDGTKQLDKQFESEAEANKNLELIKSKIKQPEEYDFSVIPIDMSTPEDEFKNEVFVVSYKKKGQVATTPLTEEITPNIAPIPESEAIVPPTTEEAKKPTNVVAETPSELAPPPPEQMPSGEMTPAKPAEVINADITPTGEVSEEPIVPESITKAVNESDTVEEAFKKVNAIKDITPEESQAFREKYDPQGNLSPLQAFTKYFNEVKQLKTEQNAEEQQGGEVRLPSNEQGQAEVISNPNLPEVNGAVVQDGKASEEKVAENRFKEITQRTSDLLNTYSETVLKHEPTQAISDEINTLEQERKKLHKELFKDNKTDDMADDVHDSVLDDGQHMPDGYIAVVVDSYRKPIVGGTSTVVEVTNPKGEKYYVDVNTYEIRKIGEVYGSTTAPNEKVSPLPKGEVEATDQELSSISPKGAKDVYVAGRKIFGLNKVQSIAQAVIVDRVVAKMAKNLGISKLAAYSKIEFRKADALLDSAVNRYYQAAWHGSPYAFDKFTTEKMGSGEGAQAFGWGLYFTDIKEIAEGYATTLARSNKNRITVNGKTATQDDMFELQMLEDQLKRTSSVEKTIAYGQEKAIKYRKDADTRGARAYESAVKFLQDNKVEITEGSRNLYKVELHKGKTPEQYDWLSWDKTLTKAQLDKINKQLQTEGKRKLWSSDMYDFATKTSKVIELKGSQIYQSFRLRDFFKDDKETSLFLLRAGIDGIKYPAESIARGTTSDNARGFNYVVFDENAITIEEVIKFQNKMQGSRGAMMMNDGKALVYAMTDPNVSTPLHEIAHVYEKYMTKAEHSAVLAWTGEKAWTVNTSEKFARGFEKYLADGVSPSKALESVFKRLKEWLADIYNGIKGSDIDIELSPNMKALYDSILTGKKYVPVGETVEVKKTPVEELRAKAYALAESMGLQNKPLFQIIGEKGAKGVEGLTEDLATAKAMTEAGVDAKKVFLATGWEKFKDGWKYDLIDGDFKGIETSLSELKGDVKLSEIWDSADLFKAFPQLKDITVRMNTKTTSNASWIATENRIEINPRNVNGIEAQKITLIHEIQHAIQAIEGFSKGGNLESGMEALESQIKGKLSSNLDFQRLEQEANPPKGWFKGWSTTSEQKVLKAKTEIKKMLIAEAKVLLSKGTISEAKYEAYHRIAGEVEARNVQYRLGLSLEERQSKMLSETQDVNEEQKIYIQNAVKGEALSYVPNQSEIGFYSTVDKALASIGQEKGSVDQFKAMLLKNGAKQAEMDWMGFDDAFKDKKSVTKQEIQKWISDNTIQVKEVTKGDLSKNEKSEFADLQKKMNDLAEQETLALLKNDKSRLADIRAEQKPLSDRYDELSARTNTNLTKFSKYVEPGGENYKELLLTTPSVAYDKEADRLQAELEDKDGSLSLAYDVVDKVSNQLFGEEYGRLNHNEQMEVEFEFYSKGDKTTFENLRKAQKEYQDIKNQLSTLRKDAYTFKSAHYDEANIVAHIRFNERIGENGERILFVEEFQSDWAQKGKKEGFSGDVPSMPFSKTDQWVNLAFRRMMRYAVENGFDRIAWTNGEMQANRYDLSKKIDNISGARLSSGYELTATKDGETVFSNSKMSISDVEDTFGKEIANKIENSKSRLIDLSGLDLAVGGEGMKAFYDAIVPSAANKLGKQFGAKVEGTVLPEYYEYEGKSYKSRNDKAGMKVQSIPVTDSMRESIPSGQPLFQGKQDQTSELVNTIIDMAEAEKAKDVQSYVRDFIAQEGWGVSENAITTELTKRGYSEPVIGASKDFGKRMQSAVGLRLKGQVKAGTATQAQLDDFLAKGLGSYIPQSKQDAFDIAETSFNSLGNTSDERIDNAINVVNNTKMSGDVMIALLARASREASSLENKATDEATKNYYVDKKSEILAIAEREAISGGRGSSYFNSDDIRDTWGHRDFLRSIYRANAVAYEDFMANGVEGTWNADHSKFMPTLDKGEYIFKGNLKKFLDATDMNRMTPEQLKKLMKEATPVVVNAPAVVAEKERITKPTTKQVTEKKKINDLFSEWKALVDQKKSGILFQAMQARNEQQILSDIIGAYIRSGVYKTEDIVAKVKAEIKAKIGLNIADSDIKMAFPTEVDGKPIAEWQGEQDDKKASEVLANRIKALASEKTPDTLPFNIMIRTLVSKASEKLSQREKVGKTDLEIIAMAIQNRTKWMGIWDEAKQKAFDKIDNGKLTDDQKLDMKARIEEAYRLATKAPFSEALLDRTIKATSVELGIKIDKIITAAHSERKATKEELIQALVDEADLSGEDAKALADAANEAFDNFLDVKSAKMIDRFIGKQDKLKPIPIQGIITLLKKEALVFKRKFPRTENVFEFMSTRLRQLAEDKLKNDPSTSAIYTDAKLKGMNDVNVATAAFLTANEVSDVSNLISSEVRDKIADGTLLNGFSSEDKAKIELVATTLQSESINQNAKEQASMLRSKAASELISMVRVGAFSNEQFVKAFSIARGIMPPTPAQIAEMERLHDRMKAEKSEILKREKELDLLAYIANLTKPDPFSVIQVAVVAGMLGGIKTFIYNAWVGSSSVVMGMGMEVFDSLAKFDLTRARLAATSFGKAFFANLKIAKGVIQSGYSHETSILDVPTLAERQGNVQTKGLLSTYINYVKYIFRLLSAPDAFNIGTAAEMYAQLRAYDELNPKWRDSGSDNKKEWVKNFLYADLGITPQAKSQLDAEFTAFIDDAAQEGRYYSKREQTLIKRELLEGYRAKFHPRDWTSEAFIRARRTTGNIEAYGTLGKYMEKSTRFLNSILNENNGFFRAVSLPISALMFFLRIATNTITYGLNGSFVISTIRLTRNGYGTGLKGKDGYFKSLTLYDRKAIEQQRRFSLILFSSVAAVALGQVGGGDDDDPWFTVTGGGGGILLADPISANARAKTLNYKPFSLKFGKTHVSYENVPALWGALAPIGNAMDSWRYGTTKTEEMVDGKKVSHTVLNRVRYKDAPLDWFASRLIAGWAAVPLFATTQLTMPVLKDFSDLLVSGVSSAMTKGEEGQIAWQQTMMAAIKYSNVKAIYSPSFLRDMYETWAWANNKALDDGDALEKILTQNTFIGWAFQDSDTPQINAWGKEMVVPGSFLTKRIVSSKEVDPVIAHHNKWSKDIDPASMKTEFHMPGDDPYNSRPLNMFDHKEWRAFYRFAQTRGNLIYEAASRNMDRVGQEYSDVMKKEIEDATKTAKLLIQDDIDFGRLPMK